jgi:adenylosuccinate synthase
VYETLPGWPDEISRITSYRRLPKNVKRYLTRIEELTETPIDIVSVGPDRDQTIILRNPYQPKRPAAAPKRPKKR